MAAFATHLLFGLLLGLALRVRLRLVPFCMLVAVAVDLDNVFFFFLLEDPWWLTRRATFQNYFVAILAPTLLAVYAYVRSGWEEDVQRLIISFPVVTVAHAFHDFVRPWHPFTWSRGWALFFPFSETRWGVNIFSIARFEPRLFDGFSLMVLVTVPLLLGALVLTSGLGKEEPARLMWSRVAMFVLTFAVLVPAFMVVWGTVQ